MKRSWKRTTGRVHTTLPSSWGGSCSRAPTSSCRTCPLGSNRCSRGAGRRSRSRSTATGDWYRGRLDAPGGTRSQWRQAVRVASRRLRHRLDVRLPAVRPSRERRTFRAPADVRALPRREGCGPVRPLDTDAVTGRGGRDGGTMSKRTPFRERGDQLGLAVYVLTTEVLPLVEVEAGSRGTILAL